MLALEITDRNTVVVKWHRRTRRQECEGEVELSSRGEVLRSANIIREVMPEDFDPETEARRMKQGGCCGEPTE